ncbi:MAG: alpha-amylase [Oligoflexales bacterium]|nr:alpha-amylase [Oligoflexales bacterium]
MGSICLYFQVHQPFRLRQDYNFFQIGHNHFYEDEETNRTIMEKIAHKCYLPTNKILLELIKKYGKQFKVSFSISGLVLEQFEKYAPKVLESFQTLSQTGNIEFLCETYHHSLAFQYSRKEFKYQVLLHKKKIEELFCQSPQIFRNTELIYNNELAREAEKMGFKGILAEGADRVLGWQSPNFIFKPKSTKTIKLLLKNYRLSDDIAFRFSDKGWKDYPLTTEKYCCWLQNAINKGDNINLFMDYETFGEHQWKDTGIFEFLWHLPERIIESTDIKFMTPSEVIDAYKPISSLDVPYFISWADTERDLSAWAGNDMQNSSIKFLYSLEKLVHKVNNENLTNIWRHLQSSDHFYYMSTKHSNDGAVHDYFNPYNSSYDAFVVYNNVLTDLKMTLKESLNQVHADPYKDLQNFRENTL